MGGDSWTCYGGTGSGETGSGGTGSGGAGTGTWGTDSGGNGNSNMLMSTLEHTHWCVFDIHPPARFQWCFFYDRRTRFCTKTLMNQRQIAGYYTHLVPLYE